MAQRSRKNQSGFTLIELLVVVAIIALLIAILLPSLSKAREQAKSAACLSNLHGIGLTLAMYQGDNRSYFPSTYFYVDGNSSTAATSGNYHWTAAVNHKEYGAPPQLGAAGDPANLNDGPYPRVANQFVCPSHLPGGWAPTNFTSTRIPTPPSGQASQDPNKDDPQAPRLSYLPNEIVMPRKKYSAAHDAASPPGTSNLTLVSADEVQGDANTILMAEFSNSSNGIWGSSVGGGSAYKSHRPINGVKSDQANNVFDGENYQLGTQIHKLTYAEAQSAITAVLADKAAAPTNHHISYTELDMHKTNGNYLFVDGHAAKHTLKETLDPGNYMWGKKVYSAVDKPFIQNNP